MIALVTLPWIRASTARAVRGIEQNWQFCSLPVSAAPCHSTLTIRRIEEEYLSAPLECPAEKIPARLGWKAQTPHGTAVKFQIRTARAKPELAKAQWHGPQAPDTYYERTDAGLSVPSDNGWLQYRVLFTSPDGGSTAFLEEVHLDAFAHR
jgi:hypothetical protein